MSTSCRPARSGAPGASELPDLSGDGNPGGAFMTGFVVVPNGNIIYTRADAIYNPQIPSQTPNGSAGCCPTRSSPPRRCRPSDQRRRPQQRHQRRDQLQHDLRPQRRRPVRALGLLRRPAAGAVATGGPGGDHRRAVDPEPSTRSAAQIGPEAPFVIQAPNPSGNQCSFGRQSTAAPPIPALTTLVFDPGTDPEDAERRPAGPEPGQRPADPRRGRTRASGVVITSYKDSSIGGVTNGDPNDDPQSPGDYGGILFRNYRPGGALAGGSRPG